MNAPRVNTRLLRKLRKRVKVRFPNGEVYTMEPGLKTTISKAVVEEFTPRFMCDPAVVRIAKPGEERDVRGDDLMNLLGFPLDYARNLPDIILADVHPQAPKVVFVEVVATDGAVTDQRKQALLRAASDAGFDEAQVYFVSAFLDRSAPAFRKLVSAVAWGTFAWFTTEPDKLLAFREGGALELSSLFSQ